MKKHLLFLSFFAALLTVFACGKDEPEGPIAEEVIPYVESFIEEANKRGFNLHIDSLGLEINFVNIGNNSVIARCLRDENGVNYAVNVDPVYFKQADDLRREYVMYHELGHCVLNRDHTSLADGQGFCLSIMEPGSGVNCTANYNDITREILLDELFSQ